MKKLRLLFALVALVVLAPVGLLVGRALGSARAELELERRALAERVIDEMEGELTAFLRREEDRPFADYRFLAQTDAGSLARSPLAEPLEPFVVGPFQLAADGEASSPLWPQNETLARRVFGWQPEPSVRAKVDLLLPLVRAAFPARQDLAGHDLVASKRIPLPADPKKAPSPGKEQEPSSTGPLELLQKLNRGAEPRASRSSKLEQTQAANIFLNRPSDLVDVRLEPMVGRALEEDRMALYRTVLAAGSAFRQGLVLDRKALLAWLSEKALAGTSPEEQGVRIEALGEEGETQESGEGTAIFRHRFAEPFGPVAAKVLVDSGSGGAALLAARQLSALLVAAVLLGLFAVYRMAAYALNYAQRRSDFVSAVTHELKTPLTAIRMYGEMLRDDMVEESRRRRYYEIIVAEGERLSRLVDNVLELARLERKEKPPQLQIGDAGQILQEAVALLRPHAEKEGFALELEIEPDLPALEVDPDALVQVIFNLVDNAIKYSQGAAEKKIGISLQSQGGEVLLAVADKGPGVAPKNLRRLFEPFWRGENELTRSTKGTGIGLALVRGLVERMGGRVSARNAEGGGLEVKVHLLCAESVAR